MRFLSISSLILAMVFLSSNCSKVGSLAGKLREAQDEQESLQTKLDAVKSATAAMERQREALVKTNPAAVIDYRAAVPMHKHLEQTSEWLDTANAYLKKEADTLEASYNQYRKNYLKTPAHGTATP